MTAAHPFSQPSLLRQQLLDADPEVRRVAIRELPYSEEDDYIELLTAALKDPHAGVRMDAALALEGIEQEDVVATLGPMLKDDSGEGRQAE